MDYGHVKADDELKKLERRLKTEYTKAAKEMKKRADYYFYNFDLDDLVMQRKVKFGEMTEKEYTKWRKQTMLTGKQWKRMSEQLAVDCQNINAIAKQMIDEHAKQVYALNFNYGTFEIEKAARVHTSFTLYDKSTVERLMKKDPTIIPKPGKKLSEKIRQGKAMRWNRKQVNSIATRSILQGDSIDKIAKTISKELAERNMASAVRTARTMTTSCENGGRLDSYERAEALGVEMQKGWMATDDNKTRDSHREINGTFVGVDEMFILSDSNEMEYPGDPNGEPEEVYNCRCTLVGKVGKVEKGLPKYDGVSSMSYEEWVDDNE